MKLTGKQVLDYMDWSEGGTITALRLDPTDSKGGRIEISDMYFEKDATFRPIPKITEKQAGPDWPAVKPETWSNQDLLQGPYFTGKMICSPNDNFGKKNKTGTEYFLRREFDLKKKITVAMVQFCADDCAELYVNGKRVAFANKWQESTCADITRSLKPGKNVFGFHYMNSFTYGGVLAEFYLQYADGSTERIVSDKNFVSSSKFEKGWAATAFDAGAWAPADEQAAPPAAPWKIKIPYQYFSNIQKVTAASVKPAAVTAGQTLYLHASGEGSLPEKDVKATIILWKKDRRCWTEDIMIGKQYFTRLSPMKWKLEYPYTVPLYLKAGVTMQIHSDTLAFSEVSSANMRFEIKPVAMDPKYPEKAVSKVVNRGNGPCLELNGKPLFLNWGAASKRPDGKTRFSDARINAITVFSGNFWPETDRIDYTAMDIQAEKYRKYHPYAYYIWNIHLAVPPDWPRKYPDEMCLDESGKVNKYGNQAHYSYLSVKARKDFEDVIKKVIDYVEKQPYANRVIAYRITGGHTSEWLGWDSRNGLAVDFSKPAKAAYRKLLQEKLPEVKDFSIPKQRERMLLDDEELLWNPQKHLRTILYYELYSSAVADFLAHLCRTAKQQLNGQKAVGAYYGYVSTLNWTGVAQMRAHYALKQLLDSKSVDFLLSPQSYALRRLGETCGEMKPFATMKYHNVIPGLEDDSRTHNSRNIMAGHNSNHTQTLTEKQTLHQMRRNMDIAICRQEPTYYYPLCAGTEMDFPAMDKEINIRGVVGQHCAEKYVGRHAEVALVVSEKSITSMPYLNRRVKTGRLVQRYMPDGSVLKSSQMTPILNYETFIGCQRDFALCGVPTDFLLAEDLEENPGQYKLYVFLNCYNYDASFLKAVNRLRERNCTLLWLYAPGWIRDRKCSLENMKELSGFDFRREQTELLPVVTLKDGLRMGTPSIRVKPMFSVTTPEAEVLGKYENGAIGAAAIKTGNARSIFSGAWQLDRDFITKIIDQAGIFRYTLSEDPMEANDALVVLHGRFAGEKSIRLPKKTDVLDIYEKKIVGRNIDRFQFSIGVHETKSFYYGKDADVLLKKLKALP